MPLKAKDHVVAHADIKVDNMTVVKRGDKGIVVGANGSWGKSYVVVFVPTTDATSGYPVMVDMVGENQITPV
ncbi:hypothetical protein GCM10027405_25040 [Arthrobacter alkaliphilus]|uniref:hypothetical protein n=1 Tax=Arthrobacter alkaliphilus TaxID=369936 RepID=UPI001F3FBD76|nr:hypothetical protein [Arthrobacter alkaliphilus]